MIWGKQLDVQMQASSCVNGLSSLRLFSSPSPLPFFMNIKTSKPSFTDTFTLPTHTHTHYTHTHARTNARTHTQTHARTHTYTHTYTHTHTHTHKHTLGGSAQSTWVKMLKIPIPRPHGAKLSEATSWERVMPSAQMSVANPNLNLSPGLDLCFSGALRMN